jgi:hypothetical protein
MSDDIHKYPSQLADRFQVRMPDGLRDRIAEAAKANGRSMNAEIVFRLEESFGEAHIEQAKTRDWTAMVDEVVAALRKNGWRPPNA